MHIAFFTNYYLPVVNGVVRSVTSFRENLMQQGHNVFVFAQADDTYIDTEPFIFRYPRLPLSLSGDVPAALPVSSFVDQVLPALKLDVFHAHHPILLGQTATRKAEEMNLPLVFTFHTQYWEYTHYIRFPQATIREFLRDAFHKRWIREFIQNCQHIILPSDSLRDILVRDYGLSDRYTVLPTGINLETFLRADGTSLRAEKGWEDKTVLISVGRLAPEKNWDTLLHAFAKLRVEHPSVHLVLIGEGTARQSLQALAIERDINDRVTFTGALPFEEIPRYLKAADLFAFASITETQGLATIEAMAAGLPIVAVDGPGTRDIVEHGRQGLLVDNDPNALANGLNELLTDPQRMKRLGQNALKKARIFGITRLGKKLVSVYEQAIQDKRENQYVTLEK